jgi:hypothetical protein
MAIRVPQAYDDLYLCNYVMYKNTSFGSKWFYGFITHKEYVNPDFTKVYFEIDVFQTWQFDLKWNPSFVAREHSKRWNPDGTPVINTVDEELNYGTDYQTVQVTQYVPFNNVFFLVIVCTQTMHGGSADPKEITPVLNGSPQPLTYYIVPFKMDGSDVSVNIDGTPQPISSVSSVLKALYTITGAQNNIASLYITEYIGYNSLNFPMSMFEPVTIQDDTETITTLYVKNLPTYQEKTMDFGDKYSGFSDVTESKLLMHPYTVTVLTDLKGNHQEIKNEYIQDTHLTVNVKGSLGVSNKVSYSVNQYLLDGAQVLNDKPLLNTAIINNSPNDVPIVTDLLAAYLQGNRNTIENQKSSILFNQIAGTVSSGLGTIMQGKMMGGLGTAQGLSESVSTLGNGYFQMAGLMAKQKDLNNVPPQINKLGGNTAFDYGNDIKGLYILKKEITPEYRKKLTDFFKLYGYKINEVKLPNLHTRQHFNFVQTVGANITGNIPQRDLTILKQVFDKGITLWHTDNMLDYSLSNGEI